ncbi:hypothetical protein O6H91_01G051300 [Diphasiastrum complanatum]|uniref:Uncharacterized protein n=1 Tax=Diphasiastrum complanatum TaxID=34168 RepID=A0ACC2EQY5_DIPCM|nr:hypothetical protein O6H91_Y309600 [Diphasiastrum complanatum]KAJ7568875.1 hypothetical protein O6H91_01G051300 [Diphasiastrum complanatum]
MPIQINSAYKRLGRTSPFVRYGLPLISLTVLGSFALGHLQQGRKDVVQAHDDLDWEVIAATKALTKEGPMKDQSKPTKRTIDLEEELKVLQGKMDINAFEYKPIPKSTQSQD